MKRKIKITAFLIIIAIALNINIGLDNKHFIQLGMGEVEASQLSPDNADTFNVIGTIDKIFKINGNLYYSAINESKLGIYKLDIENKKSTLLFNVDGVVPNAQNIIHYKKTGNDHKFVVYRYDGAEEYVYISVIKSSNMSNFTLEKLNAQSFRSCFIPRSIEIYDVGDVSFLTFIDYYSYGTGNKETNLIRCKSIDLINWTRQFTHNETVSADSASVSISYSNPIDTTGKSTILGMANHYNRDNSSGYRNRAVYYNHLIYNGTSLTQVNPSYDCYCYEKESSSSPVRWVNREQSYRHILENFGTFTYIFREQMEFNETTWEPTIYVRSGNVALYYGNTGASFGSRSQSGPNSAFAYNDNGVYSKRVAGLGSYLYYLNSAAPAGTLNLKAINGTNMTTSDVFNISNVTSSESFTLNNSLYYSINTSTGTIYYKITNGVKSNITKEIYDNDYALTPLVTPDSEYTQLGYSKKYVDNELAIFFNSSERSVKVVCRNQSPTITLNQPTFNSPLQAFNCSMREVA